MKHIFVDAVEAVLTVFSGVKFLCNLKVVFPSLKEVSASTRYIVSFKLSSQEKCDQHIV